MPPRKDLTEMNRAEARQYGEELGRSLSQRFNMRHRMALLSVLIAFAFTTVGSMISGGVGTAFSYGVSSLSYLPYALPIIVTLRVLRKLLLQAPEAGDAAATVPARRPDEPGEDGTRDGTNGGASCGRPNGARSVGAGGGARGSGSSGGGGGGGGGGSGTTQSGGAGGTRACRGGSRAAVLPSHFRACATAGGQRVGRGGSSERERPRLPLLGVMMCWQAGASGGLLRRTRTVGRRRRHRRWQSARARRRAPRKPWLRR